MKILSIVSLYSRAISHPLHGPIWPADIYKVDGVRIFDIFQRLCRGLEEALYKCLVTIQKVSFNESEGRIEN